MKNSTYERGFTLIESLVAITVLTLVIVGTTQAARFGLASYSLSKDQVVAFYLAQEGFEQIRNMRDENIISNRAWLSGISYSLSDPCYYGSSCTVDPKQASPITTCPTPTTCPSLRQDTASGFYGYDASWPATNYVRTISLSPINSEEVVVTVTVAWNRGTVTYNFRTKENLYNW